MNGLPDERERWVGVIVRCRAEIRILRDHSVRADVNRGEVINLGTVAQTSPIPHLKVPGHPDANTATDHAVRSDLGPEQPQKKNAQPKELARYARPERKLDKRPQ
jgi:hypothetical protein